MNINLNANANAINSNINKNNLNTNLNTNLKYKFGLSDILMRKNSIIKDIKEEKDEKKIDNNTNINNNNNKPRNKLMEIIRRKKKQSTKQKLPKIEENEINENLEKEKKKSEAEEKILFQKITDKYDDIFKKLKDEKEKVLFDLEKKRDKINKRLEEYEKDIKKLKFNIKNINIQQKDYYLDILEKGIDVRSEGLSWVVKKILELNIYIDNSNFPKFLENNHIEYLIFMARKHLDISQSKFLIESLKAHIKKNKNKGNNNFNISDNSNSNFNNNKKNLFHKKYFNMENKEINLKPPRSNLKSIIFSGKEKNNDNKKENNYENNNLKTGFSVPSAFDLNTASENYNLLSEKNNIILNLDDELKNSIKENIEINDDEKDNKPNELIITNKNEKIEQNLKEKLIATSYISKIFNIKTGNFYLKSFSEKSLSTLEEILKNYELMGVKYFNRLKEEDDVIT
jgi:hypothetical protein